MSRVWAPVAGQAPPFQVTQVETFTPEQNAQLARRVRGTVSVPCYLEPNCALLRRRLA